MLVLGRREGERLVIDGGIQITILAVKGGLVRIGIIAPEHINILRGEIADREVAAATTATAQRIDADLID